MRKRVALSVLTILLIVLLLAGNELSASQKLDKSLYSLLERARTELAEGRAESALSLLNKAEGRAHSSYAIAIVQQTYGYAWLELHKDEEAARAFRKALEAGSLPDDVEINIRYNLAGLLGGLGRTEEATALLETNRLQVSAMPVQMSALLARLYLDRKRYRDAIDLLEETRRSAPAGDENLLLILAIAYMESGQPAEAVPAIRKMIELSPRKAAYWEQLVAAYLSSKQMMMALATFELAWLHGVLTRPQQIRYMAQLYMQQGLPYKAGRLLETGLAEGRFEADAETEKLLLLAWRQAREDGKAIERMEHALVSGRRLGADIYELLAQQYVAREDWNNAERVLLQGIAQVSKSHRGRLSLILGMTHYRQQHFLSARKAFEAALHDKISHDAAAQWLAYVDYLQAATPQDSTGQTQQ